MRRDARRRRGLPEGQRHEPVAFPEGLARRHGVDQVVGDVDALQSAVAAASGSSRSPWTISTPGHACPSRRLGFRATQRSR